MYNWFLFKLWSEENLIWAFSLQKFAKTFFVIYHMICPWEWFIPEKNVYSSAVGWNILYVSLKFFDIKYNSSNLFPCWFSVWLSYLFLKMAYLNPLLLLFCYIFFPSDMLVFTYHIWVNIEHIFFKNCYILWWIYPFSTM